MCDTQRASHCRVLVMLIGFLSGERMEELAVSKMLSQHREREEWRDDGGAREEEVRRENWSDKWSMGRWVENTSHDS